MTVWLEVPLGIIKRKERKGPLRIRKGNAETLCVFFANPWRSLRLIIEQFSFQETYSSRVYYFLSH